MQEYDREGDIKVGFDRLRQTPANDPCASLFPAKIKHSSLHRWALREDRGYRGS
jgi:hypothetical protein